MNHTTKKSFLVFSGGNDRAVFGFLRALRLCGCRAHIVARTYSDRVLRSSFQQDVRWVRPDHSLTLNVLAECIQHVRTSAGDETLVLLPSTEYFNTFLLQHRSAIEEMNCEIPLVDAKLYARLTGKRSATDFFSEAGLATPTELTGTHYNPPVVAKPVHNVSIDGQSLYPCLLDTQARVDRFLTSHDVNEYFFQEYVDGDSIYLLFYLSRDGQQNFTWSQRNLLQQPNGKSMLLAEPSDFYRSGTAEIIISSLREAGFYGLGMVEIIHSCDRKFFIEMNPRIWGPAQFCLDQGQILLQAFVGETLYDDPMRFLHCIPRSRRDRYFWFGGALEATASGQPPTWHSVNHRSLFSTTLRNLSCDVYLRKDSWRCFVDDLATNLKWRSTRERTKD